MCGRFTQNYTWEEVYAFLKVFGTPRNLRPHYNIAPTTNVDVIRLDREGRRELVSMRWGLVPYFWKKSLKEMPATFNARAETVAEKPMFRDFFKRRRCIIPACGFFEWTDEADGKQPHLFTAADGSPILAFAGLWDRWIDPASKEEILSCTVIVSGASAMDDGLSRSHAGAAAGGGFRRLAQRIARGGGASAGGRKRAARMAGVAAREPHRCRR